MGFEKTIQEYSYSKDKAEEEFGIKIIASEKSDMDREVLISGITIPNKQAIFSIVDKKALIIRKKKSTIVQVKIYPKLITNNSSFRLICTPQNKDSKPTQLTVRLKTK